MRTRPFKTMLLNCLLAVSAAGAISEAADPVALNIAAQPIGDALNELARQTGLQVVLYSQIGQGVQAPAIKGRLTTDEAFGRLLAGSGLKYRFLDERTVMVISAAAEEGKPTAGGSQLAPMRLAQATTQSSPAVAQGTREESQETESAYGSSLNEIVVTGLRRLQSVGKIDVSVLETPQSISIISGERIEATMSQTVMDVLQYTAGVRSNAYLDTRRDDFAIRGFGEAGRSGVFRDGLRLPALTLYGFWEMDPYGLDRVEVMRGPASVLYGQSSPGGVVNLVTKRPTETALHEVGLVLGSYNRKQGTVDFGGPLNDSGSVLYRFTGLGRDADTQVDFTQDRRVYVAPALTWLISDSNSLTVLSNYQKSWNSASPQFLPFEGTVLSNPNGDIPFSRYTGEQKFDQFDKTQSSVGYLFEHKFSGTTSFLQNARYGRLELDYKAVYPFGLHPDMATINRYSLADTESMDSVAVDNQIQTRWSAGSFEHQILAGADYQHSTGSLKTGFGAVDDDFNLFTPVYGTPVATPAYTRFSDRKSKQVGVYLQDHLKIGERFVVHAALRHDWAKSEAKNPSTGVQLSDVDDKATTYQLGLAYLFANGVAPYVSYSTSFSPLAGVDVNGKQFVPEEGKQIEGGFKFDLRPVRTFATIAVFDLRKQNVPTAASRDDPFGPEIQAGEIRSKGVELEFNANPLPGFNVLGSYTHNDVEVTKSNLVGMAGEVGSIPDYHASELAALWGNYTLQNGGLAGVDLGLGVRYVGSVEVAYPVGVAPFKVPSYTLLDAAISYERAGYRFALNLNNLTNDEYVGACDPYTCYYGIGRSVMGSVKYKW